MDDKGSPSPQARRDVNLTHYVGMIEMEALCMIDMIVQQIIPALKVTIVKLLGVRYMLGVRYKSVNIGAGTSLIKAADKGILTDQLKRNGGPLPEHQVQNLALTVVFVQHSLDSGP